MKQTLSRQTLWRCLVGAAFLALFVLACVWANSSQWESGISDTAGTEYETARVVSILGENLTVDETIEGRYRGNRDMVVEILTGRYAGQTVSVRNYFSALYNIDVAEGDTLSVRIDTTGLNEFEVNVYNYDRIPAVFLALGVFALALILIGGWQGFRALLGLIFTFVAVVWLLLPLALKGWPTVPLTVAIVGVTSAVSYYLLGGWQPKFVGAAIGCFCGVAAAALLGQIAIEMLHISAYEMDEAEGLLLARYDTGLQLNGLLLSGILISAEGAVMDTAMSVSSAMAELKLKRPDIAPKELFQSGMRIGRDATGTMANTLVLAFAGSSLNMMVLIYSYHVSFIQLMNTDFVAEEVVRAVAGSMGIILTVPCVAGVCTWLLSRKKKK